MLIITIYWRGLGSSGVYRGGNYSKSEYVVQSGVISIFLWSSIYILVIVAKLYKELASVVVARQGDWVELPERVAVPVLRVQLPPEQ